MKKFEYKKVMYSGISDNFIDNLNKHGQKGWEFIGNIEGYSIFKREENQEKKWNRSLL